MGLSKSLVGPVNQNKGLTQDGSDQIALVDYHIPEDPGKLDLQDVFVHCLLQEEVV